MDSTFGHSGGGVVDDIGAILKWNTPIDPIRRYIAYWHGHGRPLCDLMDPTGNPLIVSRRALEVIQQFRLPDEIEFGHVRLIDDEDDSVVCDAEMIHLRSVVWDVMDPEDLEAFERLPPLDRLEGIPFPPRVRWDLVSEWDLIEGLETNWICSEPLKDAIEEAGLTGARFIAVEMK